jgi:hypothetical protein
MKSYRFISTTDSTCVLFDLVCWPLSFGWGGQGPQIRALLETRRHSCNAFIVGPYPTYKNLSSQ